MSSLLDGLNPAQRRACEALDGPTLILAGAGSGKTRTLTHRVAHLLSTGKARPQQVLTVTFTNKAAGELRERLGTLLPDGSGGKVWAMTFHALCVRILRQSGEAIGLDPRFSIADSDDSRRLVKECLKAIQPNNDLEPAEIKRIRSLISYAKNHTISREELAERADDSGLSQLTAQVWHRYQERMREMGTVDFDDLLLLAIEVLDTPEGKAAWAGRFSYVLVDEYQDTNQAQYELMTRLMGPHRNLCVVGDEAQSIYRFRGAQVELILRFEKDWPDATVIKLEQNYRSSPSIIEAANAVLRHSTETTDKKLLAVKSGGEPVRMVECDSGYDEAYFVAKQTAELVRRGAKPEQIAVVYRNNAQSQDIEEKLSAFKIPYRVIGGTEFLARAEVKTARAYVQLLDNPRDRLAFERAITHPKRGVGDAALTALAEFASQRSLNMLQAAAHADQVQGPNAKARAALKDFAKLYTAADNAPADTPLSKMVAALLRHSGLLESMTGKGKEGDDQLQNVGALVSVAKRFDRLPWRDGLTAFLEQTALSEGSKQEEGGAVSLMTVHATKGLEFPYVFLIGLEEQVYFPREPDRKELEETRRLLYVGITRAMHMLWLCRADRRLRWGQWQDQTPLRFLGDLPASVQRMAGPSSPRPDGQNRGQQQAGRSGARPTGRSGDPSARRPGPPPRRARANPAAAKVDLSRHAKVSHPKFGRGVVLSDDGEQVLIRFEGGVTKKLLKQWANLTVL